jgi:hypothetical protein
MFRCKRKIVRTRTSFATGNSQQRRSCLDSSPTHYGVAKRVLVAREEESGRWWWIGDEVKGGKRLVAYVVKWTEREGPDT